MSEPEPIPGGLWEWHCRRPDCGFWCFQAEEARAHYRTSHELDDLVLEQYRVFREMQEDPFGGLFELNARLGYGPDI